MEHEPQEERTARMLEEEGRHDERLVRETSRRNDYFLGISVLAAGVLIAGAVIYSVGMRSGGSTPPTTSGGKDGAGKSIPELVSDDVILGEAKAPVTIFEFADFQCPFCGMFHFQTAPQIREQYIKAGKVKMVYRDFPFLGQESVDAALAARCAQEQGKFWEYHDALYDAERKDGKENNGNITRQLLESLASAAGMNVPQWGACYDARKYETRITGERTAAANDFGVNSTPTFFINGVQLLGAQPWNVFRDAIEAALKK